MPGKKRKRVHLAGKGKRVHLAMVVTMSCSRADSRRISASDLRARAALQNKQK